MRLRLRPARTAAVLTAVVALGLSACTARMDMIIAPAGTYDAVLVMRDTTGTVLAPDTDCQKYADPSLVGGGEGTSTTATPIGSPDDDEGVGCEVRVTGVTIPDSGESGGADGEALVVRDGDLYVVTLTGLPTDQETSGTRAPQAEQGTGEGGGSGATTAPTGSLASVVDAHLSITFPGAVVDAGGGSVSGRTVTWDDADVLANGVTASGYASENEGVGVVDRFWPWIITGIVAAGLAAGGAVVARRRRSRGAQRPSAR